MDKIRYNTFNNLTYCILPPAPLLPPPYQQVEYLQSDSTNDNANSIHIETGLNYYPEFECELMRTNNASTKFLGISNDACLQRDGDGGHFMLGNLEVVFNDSILQRTTIKWKDRKIYVNDSYVRFWPHSFSSGNFMLYGVPGRYFTNIRIYHCKLWDANGVCVRDMYPCRRIADSVLGFYDRVTKTFFEPVGTIGSFIAGSDI